MNKIFLILAAGFAALTMQAQQPYQSIPMEIWPGKIPGKSEKKAPHVFQKDNEHIDVVTTPTLELFKPSEEKKNNQAIVVCPGGAYRLLAYVKEGQEIAKWLTEQGYTVYVLAYRVPGNREGALQDAFRAIRIVRSKGFEKVGLIGFSAGASLSCRAATRWKEDLYPAQDKADKLSQRPDYAMLIYPAYLDEGENHTLSPELTVNKETCPLFVWGTQDDKSYGAPSSLTILQAMVQHGAPIELHFQVKGGHGYGMRGEGAAKIWPKLAEEWLKTQR